MDIPGQGGKPEPCFIGQGRAGLFITDHSDCRLSVLLRIDSSIYVYYSGHMELSPALSMFSALAQETRLRVVRLLVKAGPDGMTAGALSEELGVPHNTMSFHFGHLANAGLVISRRQGRSVIYSANFEAIRNLIGFLVQDCCSADFASLRTNRRTGCAVIELPDFC